MWKQDGKEIHVVEDHIYFLFLLSMEATTAMVRKMPRKTYQSMMVATTTTTPNGRHLSEQLTTMDY